MRTRRQRLTLTPAERAALERAAACDLLLSRVPDQPERDIFGQVTPGVATYRRLDRRGLLVITEEDLIDADDPALGCWTPSVEITEAGRDALRAATQA